MFWAQSSLNQTKQIIRHYVCAVYHNKCTLSPLLSQRPPVCCLCHKECSICWYFITWWFVISWMCFDLIEMYCYECFSVRMFICMSCVMWWSTSSFLSGSLCDFVTCNLCNSLTSSAATLSSFKIWYVSDPVFLPRLQLQGVCVCVTIALAHYERGRCVTLLSSCDCFRISFFVPCYLHLFSAGMWAHCVYFVCVLLHARALFHAHACVYWAAQVQLPRRQPDSFSHVGAELWLILAISLRFPLAHFSHSAITSVDMDNSRLCLIYHSPFLFLHSFYCQGDGDDFHFL